MFLLKMSYLQIVNHTLVPVALGKFKGAQYFTKLDLKVITTW